MKTTFTFPGFTAGKATGIDVLRGLSQELLSETERGNLVIRDVFLTDYPIILRLTP